MFIAIVPQKNKIVSRVIQALTSLYIAGIIMNYCPQSKDFGENTCNTQMITFFLKKNMDLL